jgi:hypothetical protein
MRRELCLLLLLLAGAAASADTATNVSGDTRLRLVGTTFPSNSAIHELTGSSAIDLEGILRLKLEASSNRWSFDAAYQLIGLYGDRVEYTRTDLPLSDALLQRFPVDDRRWFDLTKVIHDRDKEALLHRLDRLWIGYTTDKTVVRFGRQAISWGNGLFYAPMDLVNPFDPATIDTEYKPGDDMLYVQHLQSNGNDVQAAVVIRRDVVTGDVDSDQATYSAKYHGFAGESEYDLLVARHYTDTVVGFGGTRSVGGAILRGDIVVTDTDRDTYLQVVANWSYSWTWSGKNVSGALEYHFNGFGLSGGNYDPQRLAAEPDLLARLARGETFTLGRNYLAGSLMIEMSPLWTLTPTLLANVGDPSALFQLVTQRSLSDNLVFLGSLNLPLGPDGSEFGGIDTGVDGVYLSSGPGVFAQIAWYF